MPNITADEAMHWLNIYRPKINWNVPQPGMVEIMGMTKDRYGYLYSGRSLPECVQQAMEKLKC